MDVACDVSVRDLNHWKPSGQCPTGLDFDYDAFRRKHATPKPSEDRRRRNQNPKTEVCD